MLFRAVLLPILSAAILLTAAVPPCLAQQRPVATGVPSGPGGSDQALFRSPQLDPLSMVMAYNRMTGTSIDFRPYAERSTQYQNATTFDRPDVLTREIARLEGQFASLDLNRVYSLRLGTMLKQYDPTRQGYPLEVGSDSYIPINDPVTYKGYGLQFRNVDEVTLLPVGDTSNARNFAQRNGLDVQSVDAGHVVVEFAFRLAEVPPALSRGVTMVRADILQTRVLNQRGQPMWDFGQTAAAREPVPQAATSGTAPVLKAADVQGIRLSMPVAEGQGIASRDYPTQRGNGRWFRNVDPDADAAASKHNTFVRCGLAPFTTADILGYGRMPGPANTIADSSEACLGFDVADGKGAVPQGMIDWITSGQRLDGATVETVSQALTAKYGRPTYTENEGRVLQWIGRDPARADGGPVIIVARIDTRRGGGVLLGVEAKPYADPNAPKAPAPAVPSAPRL